MVEPILQALQAANNALAVQLPATLAGLTLTALTFLTLRLADLKDEQDKLVDPPPLGQGRTKEDDLVKKLQGRISEVREGVSDFYWAFYLFLASLLLMLAVFDTTLAAYVNDVPSEIINVVGTGGPFAAGLIFLMKGARKIKKYYVDPKAPAT